MSLTPSQILAKIYHEAEERFSQFDDLAHGWEHVLRVYNQALLIAREEGADLLIVGIAALLHDIGRLHKQKGRPHAEISVEVARTLLSGYPLEVAQVEAILHAIAAHSFSRNVEPRTLEARVMRDADRLDGMGAIGILRWAITGTLKRQPQTRSYHPADPFAEHHQPDDKHYMLDHFYTKLLILEENMGTATGRLLAKRRSEFMRNYLLEFKNELGLLQPLDQRADEHVSGHAAAEY